MSVDDTRPVPRTEPDGSPAGRDLAAAADQANGDTTNGHSNGNGNGTAPTSLDLHAAAAIGAPPLQVAPGDVAHSTLSVTNLRKSPCTFELTLSGIESGWYGLPARVGPLAPGERAHVPFHLSLPRGYPPCTLLLSVEARPLATDLGAVGPSRVRPALPARPGRPAVGPPTAPHREWTTPDDERRAPGRHDLQVLVGDGATIAARIDPADVAGGRRGRFSLVLRNRGSQSQQVRLEGVVPDQKLEVGFKPEAPLLLPGHEFKVDGRIRTHRPFSGEPQRHPFAVKVQGRGTPVTAEGSYTAHPLLPGWAFKSIVIGLVIALWAAVAILGISALSHRLHQSALQNTKLGQHHHHATSPSTSAPPKTTTSSSPSTSPGSSSSGSAPSTSGKKTSKKTSGAPTTTPTGPKQTVDVTGKVGGLHPGGVTVTLSPTSLVSPQVLGASGSPGATLASSVHQARHERGAAARAGAPAGVTYGPGAVLTASVRHGTPGQARAPARSEPVLVRASHRASSIPDGKVYGTEAAAAFFPGLVAAITPTLTMKTSPDGSFVFTGVPAPGTYLLSFSQPGYNTRKYVVQTTLGKNVTLDTALSPGTGSLSGTVTGPKGPLGGVSITVSNGSVTITTVTPTSGPGVGTWSVSGLNTPDSYVVTAADPGYGTQITSAALAASASLAGVDLKLTPGVGSISGTVTDASSGQGVGDVTVTATDGTASATATTATVSPIGTYTLPNLPIPGTWTLTISGPGWITQTQLVKLTGNTTVNAALTTSGANVVGVVKSGGTGLANVGLSLSNQKTTYKTLSESVSPVGGFDFAQIPPGQYVLSATSYGYTTQSASVNVSAGQTVTVDLTMPFVGASTVKPGTITGSVVNQGTGAALATVPMEIDGKVTSHKTNSGGVYSITGVAPGLHEVTALGASQGFANAGVQVSVSVGTTVTAPIISLPGLATLTGVVLSAATGQPVPSPTVMLLVDNKPVTTPTKYSSSTNGTYSITDIPAGNYVLEVSASGYDTSETSVSLNPGEALTDNVTLTQGPSYQAKTYVQTTSGTLQPQAGVCVVLARTTAGTKKTPVAKLTTTEGGPVAFSALISADTYVVTFELPTSALSNPTTCLSLTTGQIRAQAAPDVFLARPDNTAIYPAVLAPSHGTISVVLQFPYVVAGGGGLGITKDCPVEASTATPATCPHVLGSGALRTLPTVSVTGTTGYATQTNGTPGSPEVGTVKLVKPGATSDVWSYPTTSNVPKFLSTQVTLIVGDSASQFSALKKTVSLPGSGSSQLDELLTPVPVPVSGHITPQSGVSITVTPNVLTPSSTPGAANNLTSTDDIGAVEGANGALKWSDPATGISGGSAQPGKYKLTLSEHGYVTLTLPTVTIPLCPPKPATCGVTVEALEHLTVLKLPEQVTLVVTPTAGDIPGTGLAVPTVTLYRGTGTGHKVDQKQLTKTGATYSATFTDELTPAAAGPYHFTVTGPGIQNYTSGPLTLPTSANTLTAKPTLVELGWLKGTVTGVLVPTNRGTTGATEPLSGATVSATSGSSCSTRATFSATTTNGAFLLVGATGGLVPGTTYHLCVVASGFTSTTGSTVVAVAGKHSATFTLTATKITQQLDVEGVGNGVLVTVTATSTIGPTLRCTFTVGSTTTHNCATVTATKGGATPATAPPTLFTFELDPTTYSFTLSAPLYEATTIGPIPYVPGVHPLEKTYTLAQQLVTVSGKVTVSATGRRSTTGIKTLPLTLTSSGGATHHATTSSSGTYTFTGVPVGNYSITVGDTYTTIGPLSFSTGTTSQFVENFTVYAPSIPVKVTVKDPATGSPANGVTVTLTPAASISAVQDQCGPTHELLEKGLGTAQTATAVGTSTASVASFTSLIPDVYKVTFTGVGSATDKPTVTSHTLVVCPSPASSPATTPATPSYTLKIGVISAAVTLKTVPVTVPTVKMSTHTGLAKTCSPVAGASTTASCSIVLLVNLTVPYTVTFTATGYTSVHFTVPKLTRSTRTKALTPTLTPEGPSSVSVTLTGAVNSLLVNGKLTLTSANHTYSATVQTTAGTVAAKFFTTIVAGTYKVLVKPTGTKLPGATNETEGTVTVRNNVTNNFSKAAKYFKLSGTLTLSPSPGSAVPVSVTVGSVTCATVTVRTSHAYTCLLPPGTYTVTYSAGNYRSKQEDVNMKSSTATEDVTLTLTPVGSVTVTLRGTATAVKTAVATAAVSLTTGPRRYTGTANSNGVVTFTTVDPGSYKVKFTSAGLSALTGATSPQTEGTITVSASTTTFKVHVATGTVTGTITLGKPAATTVTVTVKIGTFTCATVQLGGHTTDTTTPFACELLPGTYTLTFTATGGYTTSHVTNVSVMGTQTTTSTNVTLPHP